MRSYDSKFIEIVGPAIGSAVGWALAWLTGGLGYLTVALMTFLSVLGGISGLAFSIMYRRYLGVLASGGARKGSPARAAYDSLRESLSGENVAVRIYKQRLLAFLDAIERFFGDVGMADRTLFPHFFGLKTPAPLWTTPALDRCLLLALVYPIVTIVLIWVISGHIGPAEAALHLPSGTPGWQRAVGLILIFLSSLGWLRCYQAKELVKKFFWFAVAVIGALSVAGVFGFAFAVDVAVAVALAVAGFLTRAFAGIFGFAFAVAGLVTVIATFAVAVAGAVIGVGADTIAFAVALAVIGIVFVGLTVGSVGPISGAFVVAVAVASVVAVVLAYFGLGPVAIAVGFAVGFALALAFAAAVAVAFAVAFAGAFAIRSYLASAQQHWTFLPVLVAVMLAIIVGLPALLASGPVWTTVGPLILFLGLLTLINAPFDWASLGLTRALLRRGLELGGWWPYAFALTDAALAAAIITFLAAAMVIGVQAFDTVTLHAGGVPVLRLRELFDGVATRPSEPEYWWLYAVLISSMIPSMLNLAIGGVSFLRGVPGLPSRLLGFLPDGHAVPAFDRAWIALILTIQAFIGIGLGVGAQALLSVGIIGYVLPWLGSHILEVARDIAGFNLLGRALALFVN